MGADPLHVYIVTYEHKHGVDVWPMLEEPTVDDVITDLKEAGSWDEEDEERSHVEVRGPWTLEQGMLVHNFSAADVLEGNNGR